MLFHKLADGYGRHRRVIALVVAVTTLTALVGISQLQYDDVPRTLFRSHDADFDRLEEVFLQFGADDADAVFLVESGGLFRPDEVVALRRLIRDIEQTPRVASVQSLVDIKIFPRRRVPKLLAPLARAVPPEPFDLLPIGDADSPPTVESCSLAKEQALTHPMVRGQLLSDDAEATLVVARLTGDNAAVSDIAPVIDQLREIAARHRTAGKLQVRLTGTAPIRAEIFQSVRRESAKFVLVGGTLAFLMALFMFRRPAAVAIVCGASLIGAAWTVGAMGLFGEKMNVITTVLPTLILVIGFTDSLHLMIDIRRERAAGTAPLIAAADAVRHLGLACFLCSATTAIGFVSLAVARIEVIQRFGILCGIGALLAMCSTLSVVPLLSSTRWFGMRLTSATEIDWPERLASSLEPVVRWNVKHPWFTAAVGTALTLVMSVSMLYLTPSNQATEALPTSSDAFTAVAAMDRRFGGSSSATVLVEWDPSLEFDSLQVLDSIDAAQSVVAKHPEMQNPSSVLNLVRSVPGEGTLEKRAEWLRLAPKETLHRFVRPDLHRAVINLRLQDIGSAASTIIFEELRGELKRVEAAHPGVQFYLTGTSVVAARNLNQMINDLGSSLGSATATIFLVMTLGFRSIRLGLISIIPNLFPMVLTATFLVLTGRPLQMTSVIVFSICLGIAVDDTIHFVNRFQRELAVDGDIEAAIMRTYRAVGSAMLMAAVVFIVGFGSLQVSEMPTTRLFSGLSCLTVFSAVFGDLLILPAMLRCFVRNRREVPVVLDDVPVVINLPAASDADPSATTPTDDETPFEHHPVR